MEKLSGLQAFSVLSLFLIGTSLFMGSAGGTMSDNWLAILVGMLYALPMMLAYGRLLVLYPGQDLFGILFAALGPWIGRVVSVFYIWFAFHLGSLVLRNFGEFNKSVAYTETPMFVPMLLVGLLCIWVVVAGQEVIGRTAAILFIGVIFVYLSVQLLSLPKYKLHYLLPILEHGWKPVLIHGFSAFSFPFAESVLFLTLFSSLKKPSQGYKVLLASLVLAAVTMILTSLRNTMIMGSDIAGSLYFPTYVATSRIQVGNFLQRIEGSSAVVFLSALFVKVSVCLLTACVGLSRVLGLKNYRSIVLQVGLLMVYLATFIYSSMMEMAEWAYDIYQYYAFPFQVVLPLLVLAVAEFRSYRKKPQQAATSGS
ncbi:GerAB/ArcD/ProY family transporter [Gorillibacterium timonense]|uniref:GerAB/ArcD/ProY family transporter n=1 Tax=Gorillibacterium timonense TaxID=1689269 RepID=UPI00071E436D|nr:endospore germination permease [Gorillibacterium timonense]